MIHPLPEMIQIDIAPNLAFRVNTLFHPAINANRCTSDIIIYRLRVYHSMHMQRRNEVIESQKFYDLHPLVARNPLYPPR